MAEDEAGVKSYPYISANVWNELRARFQKSVPAKVSTSYLQTALGFGTEKAAKNLLPQLRTVGIIDSNDTPTDLGKRFRIDAEYAAAAKEILEAVYPAELRDLFPGPTEDASEVSNWFMRHTGGGKAASGSQARFYLQLASGTLPVAGSPRRSSGGDTSKVSPKPRAKTPTSEPLVNTNQKTPAKQESNPSSTLAPLSPTPTKQRRPNLHVDVQVHISADASTDQIDAVFASMAKHLYGTEEF